MDAFGRADWVASSFPALDRRSSINADFGHYQPLKAALAPAYDGTVKCADKEVLQQKCTATWDTYVETVRESGLSVDPRSGTVIAPSISELVTARVVEFDPKIGRLSISAFYSAAIRLRGEHLRASLALSRHLSKHRC
jgi:hypothetical protein